MHIKKESLPNFEKFYALLLVVRNYMSRPKDILGMNCSKI